MGQNRSKEKSNGRDVQCQVIETKESNNTGVEDKRERNEMKLLKE